MSLDDQIGLEATVTVSLAQNGNADDSAEIVPAIFGSTRGRGDLSDAAIVVNSYYHENDANFNRIGDPDGDETFEINQEIEARTGGGERGDVTHIITSTAGIEVVNQAASQQSVVFHGTVVDPEKVFVEQAAGVADTNEVTRDCPIREQNTINEVVTTGEADLIRRKDFDDDGTDEVDALINDIGSATVDRELKLQMKTERFRENREDQIAIQADGGSRDMMLLGSIGVEL